jgi:hypothetical protein
MIGSCHQRFIKAAPMRVLILLCLVASPALAQKPEITTMPSGWIRGKSADPMGGAITARSFREANQPLARGDTPYLSIHCDTKHPELASPSTSAW